MDESEAEMTDAQAVEQGVLRAVGKLVLIVAVLGLLWTIGYSLYTNSEAYQDQKAQEEMIDNLRGNR